MVMGQNSLFTKQVSDKFGHWCGINIHPHETQPRLHNPLGLSQGLKSSSTGHQIGAKTASIAMRLQDIMVQSPPCRKWYVFYVQKYVR